MTRVRPARADERLAVLRVLEGALLDVDPAAVERRIRAGTVLVAVGDGPGADEAVRGALVAVPRDDPGATDATRGAHLAAVAVHPRHRRAGLGSALVEAAADRWGRLTADFDADVRGFYEALDFEVERVGSPATAETGGEAGGDAARLRGVRE